MSWHRTLALVIVVALLYLRGSLVPQEDTFSVAPLSLRIAVAVLLTLLCVVLALHVWVRWCRTKNGVTDPDTGAPPSFVAKPWAMVALCAGVWVLSGLLVITALT